MSYTVFALKWRPQNFNEVVGQGHIITTLKNALDKKRLANAYLFTGPRGVGKTSTARILAKVLNCKDGPTLQPCGKCVSCVEITKGNSLDVLEIDGASNRQIDDIRTLRENVKFAPVQGRFKVYIIDEVHMLTPEAFNALLKTLEEPPSFVKFIFATTHPHKIPSTVLSRCQRLDFRRLRALEIVEQLDKIAGLEKIEIDKPVLFAIAKSSDGSLRDAESILDQLASFSQGRVSLKDTISVLGLIEQDVLFEITDRIIAKDSQGILELLNRIIDEGKDVSVFIAELLSHFRNLMVTKISQSNAELIDLPQEDCERLLKQSQSLKLEEIFSAFNTLVAAQEMGKKLDSLRIPLEVGLVKLTHKEKPETRNQKPEIKTFSGNTSVVQAVYQDTQVAIPDNKKEEPEKDAINITLEDIKNSWQLIIDNLSRVKMSVATYFNEGSPVKLDKNVLTISFPGNYSLHKESLEIKDNRLLIEKIISDILKDNLRINFILSKEIAVNTTAQENPFIKNALETFNGRLV